jgi:hypothetical protein
VLCSQSQSGQDDERKDDLRATHATSYELPARPRLRRWQSSPDVSGRLVTHTTGSLRFAQRTSSPACPHVASCKRNLPRRQRSRIACRVRIQCARSSPRLLHLDGVRRRRVGLRYRGKPVRLAGYGYCFSGSRWSCRGPTRYPPCPRQLS